MPAPSNPPPSDEAGAILSPRQLNRWLDVNPVHPLTRTQTYLVFPLFEIETNWLGYSNLIAAYNFEGERNFTLPPYEASLSPNYLLCISWVDSNNDTHRYKLWEDVGEVFYFDVPLYTGQLIKKNFRFEVWSVEPDELLTVTLIGAGTASVNKEYTYSSNILWEGGAGPDISRLTVDDVWGTKQGGNTYYFNNSAHINPFGLWTTDDGVDPAPYAYYATSYEQTTNLTFYTSVRGNYDYMWQEDMALSTASAIVTNFNIADTDNPWTAPADSVSTINE